MCLCGGGGACLDCTLRRQGGMIPQRCSSPQLLSSVGTGSRSSRGIRACFRSSSQVVVDSYLKMSDKDVYCKEIL